MPIKSLHRTRLRRVGELIGSVSIGAATDDMGTWVGVGVGIGMGCGAAVAAIQNQRKRG